MSSASTLVYDPVAASHNVPQDSRKALDTLLEGSKLLSAFLHPLFKSQVADQAEHAHRLDDRSCFR